MHRFADLKRAMLFGPLPIVAYLLPTATGATARELMLAVGLVVICVLGFYVTVRRIRAIPSDLDGEPVAPSGSPGTR